MNFVSPSAETGRVIMASLFSEGDKTSHENCLNRMINQRDLLVSEFLKSHQELLSVQYELTELKQAVIGLFCIFYCKTIIICDTKILILIFHLVRHKENRILMKKINELTFKPRYENLENNEIILQLKRNLMNVRAKREIVRNVLQGLILESGVDWADDEHLLKLMLVIGEEL